MNKEKSDKYYMDIAMVVASQSCARNRKVGAVIVKDNCILAEGFNGTPSGRDNNCELESTFPVNGKMETSLITKPEVLHAESNAITKCAKYGRSTLGATIYITTSPCMECSKLIIQAGITRVVYKELYHDASGLSLLEFCGITIERLK